MLNGGEAGIGKTALAEAPLAEATARGALVLMGRCYELVERPPYGPWAEVLARAPRGEGSDPPPDPGGDGATSRAALFAAVRDSLATLAARQPVVLLVDDLHRADPASLDLLRLLSRDLTDLPLLFLATYRADEVAGDHPLTPLLPALVRESGAERLDRCPLDGAAIDALVAARYAFHYLAAPTEGDALFLGELLRTLADGAAAAWGDRGDDRRTSGGRHAARIGVPTPPGRQRASACR